MRDVWLVHAPVMTILLFKPFRLTLTLDLAEHNYELPLIFKDETFYKKTCRAR